MKVGYGRGYYGTGQLAPSAPKRRTSWFKIVAVVGVGAAVVWLMWPRNKPLDQSLLGTGKPPDALPPSTLPPAGLGGATAASGAVAAVPAAAAPVVAITPAATNMPSLPAPSSTGSASRPAATGAFLKQVEDDARARGFVSASDYEDSVIATAKQLQATGAQVVLAPHLQHLAPLLAS